MYVVYIYIVLYCIILSKHVWHSPQILCGWFVSFSVRARPLGRVGPGVNMPKSLIIELNPLVTHRIHGAGIYANIGGILTVNVTIYSIHGSYGLCWAFGGSVWPKKWHSIPMFTWCFAPSSLPCLPFWVYLEVLVVDKLRICTAFILPCRSRKFVQPPWQNVNPTPCCGWQYWMLWKMLTTGRKRCNFCATSALFSWGCADRLCISLISVGVAGVWFVRRTRPCEEWVNERGQSIYEYIQKTNTSSPHEIGQSVGHVAPKKVQEMRQRWSSDGAPCLYVRWQPGADVALHLGCIRLLLRVNQVERALQLYGTLEDCAVGDFRDALWSIYDHLWPGWETHCWLVV